MGLVMPIMPRAPVLVTLQIFSLKGIIRCLLVMVRKADTGKARAQPSKPKIVAGES